jgi:hypothetical protein
LVTAAGCPNASGEPVCVPALRSAAGAVSVVAVGGVVAVVGVDGEGGSGGGVGEEGLEAFQEWLTNENVGHCLGITWEVGFCHTNDYNCLGTDCSIYSFTC